MFTYKLIDGGYEIYKNGVLFITQPFYPNNKGKINNNQCEVFAKLVIKKLERGLSPFVELEEEDSLKSNPNKTEKQLKDMIDKWELKAKNGDRPN